MRVTRIAGVGVAGAAVVAGVAIATPTFDQDSGPDRITNTPTSPTSGPRFEGETPALLPCCLPEDQALRPGGSYLVDPMLTGTDPSIGFVVPGEDWVHFGAWTNKGAGLRSTAEILISDVEAVPRDACDLTQGWRNPGRNALALGTTLAELEQMTVLQPPTQQQQFGYPAVHLRLQGPPRDTLSDCNDGNLALLAGGEDRNMSSGQAATGQIHDLLLLDVNDQIVAIEQPGSPTHPPRPSRNSTGWPTRSTSKPTDHTSD